MNRFAKYITEGQGIGAKFLFALALLLALHLGWVIKNNGMQFIPQAQAISDQLLPIKVENSVVTVPQNMTKNVFIPMAKQGITFSIDTTRDSFDINGLKDGVYLSRKAIYTVSGQQVKVNQLTENLDIPKGDYRGFFAKIINWTAFFMVLAASGLLFLFYLAITLAYSLLLVPVARIAGRSYNFDQRMRLSAAAVTAAVLLRWILSGLVYTISFPGLLLLIVVFQGLSVLQLVKSEKA